MTRSVLLAGILLIPMAVLGGVYLALPTALEWAVTRALAERGFAQAQVRIEAVGLTEIVAADVDLGADTGTRAARVEIAFSPGRLVDGIIDGVRLQSPEANVGLGAQGLDLGPLAAFAGAPGDDVAAAPALRVLGPVTVADGRVWVRTPVGEVAALIDGEVLFTDGIGTEANFRFALDHPEATVRGDLDAVLDPAGDLRLGVGIENASSDARLAFAALTGRIDMGGNPSAGLEGAATLTAEGVVADGVPLGTVDVSGAVAGRGARLGVIMGGDGTGIAADLTLESADIFDPGATLSLSGELATDGLRGPLRPPGAVDAVGQLAVSVAGARRDLQALAAVTAEGRIESAAPVTGRLEADYLAVTVPDSDLDLGIDGALGFRIDAAGLRLAADGPLALEIGLPPGRAVRRIDARLAPLVDVPLLIAGPGRDDPMSAAAAFDARLDGRLPLSGEIGGTVWLGDRGPAFEDFALRLDPVAVKMGGLSIDAARLSASLSGPPDDLDIGIAAELGLAGVLAGDIEIVGGRVDIAGVIDLGATRVRLLGPGCIDLGANSLVRGDVRVRPGPVRVCPQPGGAPLLTLVRDGDGPQRLETAFAVDGAEIAVDGWERGPVTGTLPRFDGTGVYDLRRGTWWGEGRLAGGALEAEDLQLSIAALDADIGVEGEDGLLGTKATVRRLRIADRTAPARLAALTLQGTAAFQGGQLEADGRVGFAAGPEAAVRVRHRLADGRGGARIKLDDWSLSTAGADLADVIPRLAGVVTDGKGSVAAEARLDWAPRGLTSSATVTLADVGFGTQPAELAAVSGTVAFNDLLRLRTDGVQRLGIGFMDAGLPLAGGTLAFALPGDGTVRIAELGWPFAGGSIRARDLSFPLGDFPVTFAADIETLDAAELARLIDVDDLEAEGRLTGRLPIRMTEDGPYIDDAHIRAVGGGRLSYRSAVAAETLKASGETAVILSKALEDFRFTDLQLTLAGPLSGEIAATAKIDGSNPNLYDGKRIELNVRLEGALRDLLQSASVIQDIPAAVRDQVQGPAGTQ